MNLFGCSYGADCTQPPAHYGWCTGHWGQLNRTGMLSALDPDPAPITVEELAVALGHELPEPELPLPEPAAEPTPEPEPEPRRNKVKRKFYASTHEKFQALVRPAEGCWGWEGPRNSNGDAPVLSHDGKSQPAARYAWEWLYGPLPEGTKHLLNTCGHHCVNPVHYKAAQGRRTPRTP